MAKMRMQDSPITKNSLIQMLEILGLKNCSIYTDYTKFLMTTTFDLENKDYKETSIITNEARKLLNENVRAHIIFNFDVVIKDFFINENNIYLKNLILSTCFKNLELEVIYLDNGEKILNGIWNLQAKTKSIELTNLLISGYINNLQKMNTSTNLIFLTKLKRNTENILLSSQFNFFTDNNVFQKMEIKNLLILFSVKYIQKINISNLKLSADFKNKSERILLSSQFNFFVNNKMLQTMKMQNLSILSSIRHIEEINIYNLKILMDFNNKIEKILLSTKFNSKVKNDLLSNMNNLIISSSIEEKKESITSSLTIDTMWHLDDTYNLDNERRLNARKIEINL